MSILTNWLPAALCLSVCLSVRSRTTFAFCSSDSSALADGRGLPIGLSPKGFHTAYVLQKCQSDTFLGALATLRKVTISFVRRVSLFSVRMEKLGCYWTDFHETWYLNIFRKSVEKIQLLLKHDKNIGYLRKDAGIFMTTSGRILLTIKKKISYESCTFYVQ